MPASRFGKAKKEVVFREFLCYSMDDNLEGKVKRL